MARMRIETATLARMQTDLGGTVEQVGFFLANYEVEERTLALGEWIPIAAEGFDFQSDYHVALSDEAVSPLLARASAEQCSLVEVHSHLGAGEGAEFSPSDILGLREWAPQMRWRLRGRPYAAIVFEGENFDALAWIEEGAEQVSEILTSGGEAIAASRLTLARLEGRPGNVSL